MELDGSSGEGGGIVGIGGIGGLADSTPKELPSTVAQREDAKAARRSFLQRYDLAGSKFGGDRKGLGQAVLTDSEDRRAKTPPEKPSNIDPSTGLPVQLAFETQRLATVSSAPAPWSLSASLRGLWSSETADAAIEQSSARATPGKQEVNSSMASVAAQSIPEDGQLKPPVLGDQPIMGKLFQHAGSSAGGGGPTQIAQNAGGLPYTSGDISLATNSIPLPAVAQNLDDNMVAANGTATLSAFYAGSDQDKTKAMVPSNVYSFDVVGYTEAPGSMNQTVFANSQPTTITVEPSKKSGDQGTNAVEVATNQNLLTVPTSRAYEGKDKELQKLQSLGVVNEKLARRQPPTNAPEPDVSLPKPSVSGPLPQPETQTRENAVSTFSLNVSDVSFKLAAASLEKGVMPEPGGIRVEEFINAFDYRDPEAAPGAPFAFAWERARYPFAQNRDVLRFSLKTASQGRQAGRPLNLVLLLDNSGSMERADRFGIHS